MTTKTVNNLLKKLEDAIASGNHQQASGFAKDLATLKVKCSVKRNRPKNDDLLNVDMYIEDRLAHQGPIPLQLPLLMTVQQLKERISNVYDIPANVQRWTINDKVADDNDATLDDLHAVEGSPIFLYLVAPNLQMFSRAKRPRIEPVPNNLNNIDDDNNDIDEDDDYELQRRAIDKSNNNIDNDEKQLTECDDGIDIIPAVDNHAISVAVTNNTGELPEDFRVKQPLEILHDATEVENKPGTSKNNPEVTENGVIDKIVEENPIELMKNEEPVEYTELIMLENYKVVPNTDYVNCPICFTDLKPFEGVRLHECLHAFCRDCLMNTIKHCENPLVKCPYVDDVYVCQSIILEREIKALVDPHIYEAHLAKSVKQAESCAGENAFHCKTPDCNGWCFYDAERNHFSCPECDATNCLRCKVIHEGKSCMEYEEEVRIANDPNHATNLTQAVVDNLVEKGEAMKCPTCRVVIMKKTGCDAVTCTMCKTEICWATKGPRWGPQGHGDTSGGCKCSTAQRCHPSCRNCH